MPSNHYDAFRHDHVFGQDRRLKGESRTLLVVILTAATMGVEIVAGVVYGSMALLADGLHMASHAAALAIAVFAYRFVRSHADDPRFSFGVGKVNAMAGYSSALLLLGFALLMAVESIERLINPVEIAFDKAILVAVVGLVVNGVSALILGHGHENEHEHAHTHSHGDHSHGGKHNDHNLRAAYLHVLADALTSVTAIVALLAGKFYGLNWLDPVMGFVGAGLISSWAFGLLRQSGGVLLDHQGPESLCDQIVESIEEDGPHKVSDLHVWAVGPQIYSVALSITTSDPRTPEHFKRLLSLHARVVHMTIEINPVVDRQV